MKTIFAQSTDLPAVPGDTLKWIIVVVVAMLLIALAVYSAFGSKRIKVEDQPPPEFRKAPKRYNHELAEQRFGEHGRRIVGLESEVGEIWRTLRVDLPDMERRMNRAGEERISKVHERVNDVLEAVSELRGKLK